MKGLPTVDLFAGAGGFGVAAERAGGSLRVSVEVDSVCCETLRANDGHANHTILEADVCDLTGDELRSVAGVSSSDPLAVVGGPPCQPFSKASYWTDPGHDASYRRARARGEEVEKPEPITEPRPDERRSLLGEFFRLVLAANADVFVMENVQSLLHPRNRKSVRDLVTSFSDAGYFVEIVKANAANYGVPQKRKRVFLLGSRREAPVPPKISHRVRKKDPQELPEAVPVGPFIAPFSGEEYREAGEDVTGRWAEQLKEIPPGSNYKHLTEWAGHPDPVFEAETRFWNFLLKLSPELPSWTINANPGPWIGPFHWESRRLRTPEMAALQTFPTEYQFCGNRRERVRQLGNAVPPVLAEKMFAASAATLEEKS